LVATVRPSAKCFEPINKDNHLPQKNNALSTKPIFLCWIMCLLCVACALPVQAQLPCETPPITFFTEGYIITKKNDTLQGLVKVEKTMGFVKKIVFKNTIYRKTKLNADDILGFSQMRPLAITLYPEIKNIDRRMVHYKSCPQPTNQQNRVFLELLINLPETELFAYPSGMSITRNTEGFTDASEYVQYWVQRKGKSSLRLNELTYPWAYEVLFDTCPSLISYAQMMQQPRDFNNFLLLLERHSQFCQSREE
jgi:hypothetical protein